MRRVELLADQKEATRFHLAMLDFLEEQAPSPNLAVNTFLDTLASMAVFNGVPLEDLLMGMRMAYTAYAGALPTDEDTIN